MMRLSTISMTVMESVSEAKASGNTSPMAHPLRQCSVAEKAARLSDTESG
jgi:hypothetical protein